MLPQRQHTYTDTKATRTLTPRDREKKKSLDDLNRSAEVASAPRAPRGLVIQRTHASKLALHI